MSHKILAINPGSTSTKIALYENETELFCKSLDHPVEIIDQYKNVQDQFEMRKDVVVRAVEAEGYKLSELSAVVGRGGMVPKVESGAYTVNELMVDRLKNNPVIEHASNLGALIAYEIAQPLGINAYIYDSVRVDEMKDIARISGMPLLPRTSTSHALNSRAMAMKAAAAQGKKYSDMNFVVAHLGGGISVTVHEKGKMVDLLSDDEGPFSPERAGRVPCNALIDLCFSGQFDKATLKKMLRGNGGLKAYLGTVDVRDVEKRIENGDEEANLILEAMAYQVAKGIGDLATVVEGQVDAIVLTGGIAYSKRITEWISKRVSFIAPVVVLAGENEMESLSQGTLRVLRGEEEAKVYTEV